MKEKEPSIKIKLLKLTEREIWFQNDQVYKLRYCLVFMRKNTPSAGQISHSFVINVPWPGGLNDGWYDEVCWNYEWLLCWICLNNPKTAPANLKRITSGSLVSWEPSDLHYPFQPSFLCKLSMSHHRKVVPFGVQETNLFFPCPVSRLMVWNQVGPNQQGIWPRKQTHY